MNHNKSNRISNGYILIYKPNHPTAMQGGNWDGYVYEHILIAEQAIGRSLHDNEVVHHLDFNRANNRFENLLVIDRGMHGKLHSWLDKGAPGWEQPGMNRVNSGKPKSIELTYCFRCENLLQKDQIKFCSTKCAKLSSRKSNRPSYQSLIADKDSMSMEAMGRKYNVSSNAIRKWIKQYEIDMATLSQAEDTFSEGAETTGEV